MTPYMIGTFNMTLPPEGPGVVPITLDFTGANDEQDIDLTEIVNNGVVSYISGVQIDTLDNGGAGAFRLESLVTGQRVQTGPDTNTLAPLYSPNPPKFRAVAIDGFTGIVRLSFVNFPIWPLGDLAGGNGIPVPVEQSGPTLTDLSLALDGTSQTLATAGQAIRYFVLQNPVGNSDVTVNLAGGDALLSGVVIVAGGSITLDGGVANAVTVSGTLADNVIAFGGA